MSRADVLRTRAANARKNADSLTDDAVYCESGAQRAAYKEEAESLRYKATQLEAQAAELEAQEGN